MITGGYIDVSDLLRGEGEWRNMQDVIRKAFKSLMDVQTAQSEKISKLNSQVIQLREELNKRPTYDDIDRIIEMKLIAEKKKHLASTSDYAVDDVHSRIANLNREIEKKVSIQYFESSLNKKMDRSDLLIRDLSKYSVKDYCQEVSKLKLDLTEIKSQLDHFTDIIEEYERKNSDFLKTTEQVIVAKSQIENVYRHLNEVYTKEQLRPLLAEKISRIEMDTALSQKADTSNLYSFTARLEHALEQHEKIITALRMSANDPTLFQQDTFMRKSSKVIEKNSGSSTELDEALKDGRIESVITGLWNRMNIVLKENEHMKKITKNIDEEMKSFRVIMKGVAAVDKVELLAVVVEEQRLRIDSILQGSTKIVPIQKELKRFDERIRDIHGFLSLPQTKNLTQILDEMALVSQDLSKSLMDVGTAINANVVPKLEIAVSRVEALEARWEAGFHDRDRVEYLMDYINLAGSSFSNLRDIAQSLRELWGIVDNRKYDVLCNPPVQTVINRLNDLEKVQSNALQILESHRQKIQHLKEFMMNPLYSGAVQNKLSNCDINSDDESRQSNLVSSFPMEDVLKVGRSATSNVNVDFEAVVGDFFNTLEDMKVPIKSLQYQPRKGQVPVEGGDIFLMSISEVDARLAELSKEKQRLRENLLSKI